MRRGLPLGVTADTELWLPPRGDGAEILVDRSAVGRTLTQAGTGRVKLDDGYYESGLRFRSTNEATGLQRRLTTPGIAFAGAVTIEAWHYWEGDTSSPALRPLLVCRATSGGENHQFALHAYGGAARITAYDVAQAAYTASFTTATPFYGTLANPFTPVAGWHYVRAVIVPGSPHGFLYLFDAHSLRARMNMGTDLAVDDLGPIQIGAETSTADTAEWTGIISDIQIRSTADLDPASLPGNLGPYPITRTAQSVVYLNLGQKLHVLDWSADGDGGYSTPLADACLGSQVTHDTDVLSVTATGDDGAQTSYTRLANLVDLDAASNSFAVDIAAGLLRVSEDPAGLTPSNDHPLRGLTAVIQCGLANDTGIRRGAKYLIPCVLSPEAGERRTSAWGRQYATGAGTTLTLAGQHPDLPPGWESEEASGVIWPGSAAFRFGTAPGRPWSEGRALFAGLIDKPPEIDASGDHLTATLVHQGAIFYRVKLGRTHADIATYPYMDPSKASVEWPTILGTGHIKLPCICIDTRQTAETSYRTRWKFGWHAVATIGGPYVDGYRYTTATLYDVDLRICEFTAPFPPTYSVFVDVDGFGVPSTPTFAGPVGPSVGALADAYVEPFDILSYGLLQEFGGVAPSEIGASLADSAARIVSRLRSADPAALVDLIERFQRWTMTHLYYDIATRKWECKDVVKADPRTWLVTDPRIIEESYPVDRELLAARATGSALTYDLDPLGNVSRGTETSLALRAETAYAIKDLWAAGLTMFYTVGQLDLLFSIVRTFLEQASYFWNAELPKQYDGIEQLDVIEVDSSERPAGASNRFRVYSVNHSDEGSIAVECFDEALYPADGSASGGTALTREAGQPFTWWQFCENTFTYAPGECPPITPLPLPDSGGDWLPCGNSLEIVQGGGFPFSELCEFRICVEAQRTGGSDDADLAFRLVEVLADGTYVSTIAHVDAVSTTAGFFADTDVTMPTTDVLVRLEYKTENGASGSLWCASGEGEDGTTNSIDVPYAPHVIHSDGYMGGVELTPAVTLTIAPIPLLRPCFSTMSRETPGILKRLVVYVDPNGSTDLILYVVEMNPFSFAPAATIGEVLASWEVSEAGFLETGGPLAAADPSICTICYSCSDGAPIVYALNVAERDPVL